LIALLKGTDGIKRIQQLQIPYTPIRGHEYNVKPAIALLETTDLYMILHKIILAGLLQVGVRGSVVG
jgi:hypothetical protein